MNKINTFIAFFLLKKIKYTILDINGPLKQNWLLNNKRHGKIKDINFFSKLQNFHLKPRQKIIFNFVKRFTKVYMNSKQLLFQIQGKAGTGKSVLIAHLVSLFNKDQVLTCAHSGTAANHINSPTTYY